jgi:hypothetical protein
MQVCPTGFALGEALLLDAYCSRAEMVAASSDLQSWR